MRTTTRGARKLREWLREERRTQEWVGEQIGTFQTTVSGWLRGKTVPLEKALAIRGLTGIPVEDWTIPEDASGPIDADETGSHKVAG